MGPDMWLGKLGHFFIILAFISAVVSAIAFWWNASEDKFSPYSSWKQLGRMAFFVHALSVFAVVSTLFYLMAAKKYVYSYVYQHASNDLPFRYLFAAFWEGQEGSTLLWAFWHVVLGLILVFTLRKWESPVVGTISLVQCFLLAMVLGVYVFGEKIGINPFALLRSEATNAPIFLQNPNFVPQDGNGLNELLRNYWMVIHPPTVFLGFASITVPFGFALGALYWRTLREWITPVLPWTLFAAGILGIGVLMGGAWAYEALSFGGFWVWDPVENASLVPWLLIVSALHLMLVFRATGYSGVATFVLTILAFILVAYSTFLTKSGVLGESSVHSFTETGMNGELLVFLLFFWVLSFSMLFNKRFRLIYWGVSVALLLFYVFTNMAGITLIVFLLFSLAMLATIHDFPKKDEEKLWSREFWMFIGSLVILISAAHIALATSVPVYNKLFDTNYTIFDQEHFDSMQIFPAILMLLFSAVVLYLGYNKEKVNWREFLFPLLTAVSLTALISVIYKFTNPLYILLLFAAWFSFVSNAQYLFSKLRGKVKIGGATIAHIGFALLLAGIVVSQSKKTIISKNNTGKVNVLGDDEELNENSVMLYENEPVVIRNYRATLQQNFDGKLRDGFEIDFEKYSEDFEVQSTFTLKPKYKKLNETDLTADPAIKRGLFKDFFTHISLIAFDNEADSTQFEPKVFKKRDTLAYDRVVYILENLEQGTTRTDIPLEEDDVVLRADVKVITISGEYDLEPVYVIRGNQAIQFPDSVVDEFIDIRVNAVNPTESTIELGIRSAKPFKQYILIKAMIFPLINLVWLGSILMFAGFIISMIERRRQVK